MQIFKPLEIINMTLETAVVNRTPAVIVSVVAGLYMQDYTTVCVLSCQLNSPFRRLRAPVKAGPGAAAPVAPP